MKINKTNNNASKAFVHVHGFGSNSSTFNKLVDRLDSFNHYQIDLHKDEPQESSYRNFVKQVHYFLDSIPEEEVCMAGISMGGAIGIEVATHKKVKALTLFAPLNPWLKPKMENLSTGFLPQTEQDIIDGWKLLVFDPSRLLSNKAFLKTIPQILIHEKEDEVWKKKLLDSIFSEENNKQMMENFMKLNKPTLVIHGENDNYVSPASIAEFKKSIKAIKTIKLSECGHAPLYEKFDKCLEEVKKFIR